jgi:hypothetical protein
VVSVQVARLLSQSDDIEISVRCTRALRERGH